MTSWQAQGAVRRIVDAREPGDPCRVSPTDFRPGDELILVNYEHDVVAVALTACGSAIFVRKGEETFDGVYAAPEQSRSRTSAAWGGLPRRRHQRGLLQLSQGRHVEGAIGRLTADPRVAPIGTSTLRRPAADAARVERV